MPSWPRWTVMWMVAFALYGAAKVATWRCARVSGAAWWRHAGYLLAWPGMDAKAFLTRPAAPPRPHEWMQGLAATAAGAAVLGCAIRSTSATGMAWVAGALGMAGLVLVLHFGLFHLLSCAWRRAGVEARPIMRGPWRATSLAEFWGRRWNTAFRDLTHKGLFAPLRVRLGSRGALVAGFVCSGLVHEAVVSLPAGGGYGGPTAYFTLHGLALLGERSRAGRRLGLARGGAGRTFAMVVLVAPLGCLFHPRFLEDVIAPFVAALGTAW